MAIVDTNTGEVLNVVEYDPERNWRPEPGTELVDLPDASPGDMWTGDKLIHPTPMEDSLKVEYSAARTDTQRLDIIARKLDLV